ncbi:MAG TPA: hypothetical protein VGP79_00350 [Bryobacteraceae bacterium]|nr:hypothetical protein [Bryobacteraceae bacterium]
MFPLAATTRPASDLTVVLDFQGARSERAMLEMQREVGTILKASGVQLEWRTRSEASRESFNDLVLVRFSGTCDLGIASQGLGKRGPLGSTYISDGNMLPFAEIACDRVGDAVRSAMSGGDFEMADVLLGRALGRVVAHELVHVLTGSCEHGLEGVHKAALSGRQLIANSLPLSAADASRLRQRKKEKNR